MAGSRTNRGVRDALQRHGYSQGEFAPGGLYHNTAGVSATAGTTDGISIAFHPRMPVQQPNALWTFDGTLRFVDALQLPYQAPSLGGVESLVELPVTMSFWDVPREERYAMGITDSLVRFSCGVEDTEDILADLAKGFAAL